MSNSFVTNFLTRAQDRFSVDSVNMSMSEWIEKNTTLKKKAFSFKGYEFQRQIVDDMHDDLSVIKISQVGLTEVQLRKALAIMVRNNGTSLIFSLPNEAMFERVSKARLKPIIQSDKVFNNPQDIANRAVRSTELFQFGQSFLYVVPATESAATSINADFVFNDEVDLSDPRMISLFMSRLQGSNYRVSQKFSTPTYPLFGIDNSWQVSDQHLYMCKCDACGHWNHPEFNADFIHLPGLPEVEKLVDVGVEFQEQLDFYNCYVKCEKCDAPLDLDNIDNRSWVNTYSNRLGRGYKVTPFVNSRLDIKYIFKSLWNYQKEEFVRGWYNTVLGQPYSDGSMQIPTEDIHACMTLSPTPPNLKDYSNLWVGVDMGQICHVVIGVGRNENEIDAISFYQVKVDDIIDHLKGLCEKYDIKGGAVDRHPYEPTAKAIFNETKGKIIPCEYRGLKDINLVKNQYEEITHSQANHTIFLDNVATRVKKRSIKLGGYGIGNKSTLVEHLRDMVREDVPGKPSIWKKLNGNDHYFHALGFMLFAPKVKDLIHYKTEEPKSMSYFGSISVEDKTDNIIGFSKKRLDSQLIFG